MKSSVDAVRLLEKSFGLTPPLVLRRLGGYEDENILVGCDGGRSKYILKIMNAADSARPDLIESVLDVLRHLSAKSLPIPYVIPSASGEVTTLLRKGYTFRKAILLSYIPGLEAKCLSLDDSAYLALCAKVGEFAGNLNNVMKDIKNLPEALNRVHMGCRLESIGVVRNRLDTIADSELRNISEEVITHLEEFCSGEDYTKTTRGAIHGDLTLQNLIFQQSAPNEISIAGIIDFMDSSVSSYVFELAALVVSVMHDAINRDLGSPFEAAKAVVAGYRRKFTLNTFELRILYFATLGRLCVVRVYCGQDILGRKETSDHTELNLDVITNLMWKLWGIDSKIWDLSVISSQDEHLG